MTYLAYFGQDLDSKKGLVVNLAHYLKIIDDVTGQIEGHIFDYLSWLAVPGNVAVLNGMDMFCISKD